MQREPICGLCGKLFSNIYIRNKHLKRVHDKKRERIVSQHLRCSLCPEEEKKALQSHDILIKHLTDVHGVTIKQFDLSFKNVAEFETWRSKENREVDYIVARTNGKPNGNRYVYYNCNRSNPSGFKNQCTKKAEKAKDSIKISGVCPSRIIVKIFKNGTVSGKFVETHVGHTDELGTKRLTKQEQAMIVDQLQAGVPTERILRDARKLKEIEVKQNNLIKRVDLDYLTKNNKKRCADLKIEEGENHKNVDEKLWRNIITKERRNANNYKHKMNVKAHTEGEEITDFVESVEFGKFILKSKTGDAFYNITYNELCDKDCRMGYCHKCEVCFHRYICDCPEFCTKTTLCKHIHAVVLHERKNSESAPGIHGLREEEMLYIHESITSEEVKEEPCQFCTKTTLCKHIHAAVLCERKNSESAPGVHGLREEDSEGMLYIPEPTTSIKVKEEPCEFCTKTTLCKHIHAAVLCERKNSESAPGVHGLREEDSEGMLYIPEPTTSIKVKDEPCQFCTETSKHIHAVVMHERKNSESAPGVHGLREEDSEGMLYIPELTTSIQVKEEPCEFSEEENNEPSTSIDFESSRQIQIDDISCFLTSLDEESFKKFMDMYSAFKKNLEQVENNEVYKKRKIEKQTNCPNTK